MTASSLPWQQRGHQKCICPQQYGSSPRTPRTGQMNTFPKSNQREGKTWVKADTAQQTTLYVNPLWLVRTEWKPLAREAQSCLHIWCELSSNQLLQRETHKPVSSARGECLRASVSKTSGLCICWSVSLTDRISLHSGHPFQDLSGSEYWWDCDSVVS